MSRSVERWWRRRLTGLLEPLRRRFERRRGRYEDLRRSLNQAQFSVTYDDYLTRVAVTAVGAGLLVAGLVLAGLYALPAAAGVGLGTALRELDAAVAVGRTLRPVLGDVGVSVGRGVVVLTLVNVAVALVAGVATAVLAWYAGYTRPRRVARRRARKLDTMLPSTVSYMYALAHGGLDPVEVVRRTARREDTYGEQAREMRAIVHDMDYLGRDFVTVLQDAADLTPCAATADFLSDMVSVLESGGDFEEFLDERRREYVEDLTTEQEAYLERIGLFAEGYVTVLVAGPIFVIILLLVIGVLGSSTVRPVNLLVYVGLPLGTVAAVLVLDRMNAPFAATDTAPERDEDEDGPAVPDDPDAAAYARRRRRAERIDRLTNPLEAFVRSPALTLVVTVPLAAVALGAVVWTGAAEASVAAFRTRPLSTTGLLAVVPFLVVAVPLAAFHESKRRYVERVRRRFPDVLSSVARANRSGISTVDAVGMEAERSTGVLGRELQRLHNDIRWFDDQSQAFLRLAGRARLRLTTRTMRLLAEANEASGNLHRTLAVAADEARFQRQFADRRSREVATYVAVAVISFLVFLGIVLLVQQFYLERIVEASAGAGSDLGTGMPGSLRSIDVEGFRLAFLHSTLVQGVCIGLVTGKLARGTVLAGVKYSVGMVLVAFAAFWVV